MSATPSQTKRSRSPNDRSGGVEGEGEAQRRRVETTPLPADVTDYGTTPSLGTETQKDTPSLSTKTKLLPTNVSDFSYMRRRNCCYVDKTAHIAGIITQDGLPGAYLCRPKGFGKSLFLSTLRCYFEGKDLFEGLQANPSEEKRPVLYLNMGKMGSTQVELEEDLSKWMEKQVDPIDAAELKGNSFRHRLSVVLKTKEGVVLLIDNFETPLVESVGTPEESGVQKFYGDFFLELKENKKVFFLLAVGTLPASHIQKELFTKFFLTDVSSYPMWAEVCGFSKPQIEETFADHITDVWGEGKERVLKEFERHYVGFDFHKRKHVPCNPAPLLYRPNDVLRMLGEETSSPEFSIQTTQPAEKSLPKTAKTDFASMQLNNFVYVDKTHFIPELLSLPKKTSYELEGNQYLLCRPRRFGKSLFCSMLRYYFEGRKDLFKGLEISKREETQWMVRPVLHFDMTMDDLPNGQMVGSKLRELLSRYEKLYGCRHEEDHDETENLGLRLQRLIDYALKKTGLTPVILLDEFDSAYHSLDDKDRDEVGQLYSSFVRPLKEHSRNLHFVLVTGITNFVEFRGQSVFNHLNNISVDANFASVCGFTEDELQSNYKEQINALAEKTGKPYEDTFATLLKMYNGYRFASVDEKEKVVNPVAVITALQKMEVREHWSETLKSSVLQETIKRFVLNSGADAGMLLPNEVTRIKKSVLCSGKESVLAVWLYLLGYLTIGAAKLENDQMKNDEPGEDYVNLCYPNVEVKSEIRERFLSIFMGELTEKHRKDVLEYLCTKNIAGFVGFIKSKLSSFPSCNNTKPFEYEIVYQAILYFTLEASFLGFVMAEVSTSKGRSDLVVKINNFCYIFELKMDDGEKERGLSVVETAAVQIINRKYWEPYLPHPQSLVLVGLEFGNKSCNISNWVHFEVEEVCSTSTIPKWRLVNFYRTENADEKAAENRWKTVLNNASKYDSKEKTDEKDTKTKSNATKKAK